MLAQEDFERGVIAGESYWMMGACRLQCWGACRS